MIENYLIQALLLGMILIISVRLLIEVRNVINKCKNDFAEVAEMEILDPKPMRMSRPTDEENTQSDDDQEDSEGDTEPASEVTMNEDHINHI